MYGNPPIFLSQVSNREDLLLPISIFDDDTGAAVNLSGSQTASGNAFTGSNWSVTVGGITVQLLTPLTIPVFPIGNQLSAFSLTVLGLNAVAGNAISIKDANPANFLVGTVTSYNSATGALVCQIGNTFQFEIRRGAPRNDGSGYLPWYDFGTPDQLGPLIAAALGTGILITDLGYIQILIPESTFRQLNPGTFNAALTTFDGVNTRQVFLANLPVLYGGVTQ